MPEERPIERELSDSTLPGVGREALIRQVLDTAASGSRLVILHGEAGVGKSFLMDELATRLKADRVWGVAALAEIPGGALAHLVTIRGTLPELIHNTVTTLAPHLCVDDLDLCDPLSIALLERVLREPRQLVVATVRTTHGALPENIRALSRQPWAALIEVTRLTRDESDAFAVAKLGGPVDAGLATEIWHRTAGNPLYSSQLLDAARTRGSITRHNGMWRATGALPIPRSLQDAINDQLSSLGSSARDTAEWLAGLGSVPAERVRSTGRSGAARQLVDAGIVSFAERAGHGSPQRRLLVFTHPLYAEAVWASTDELRRQDVLADHLRAERAQPSPDELRLAVLGLMIGEQVPPSSLLAAARLAVGGAGTQGVETALRLAQATLAAATGDVRLEAVALVADALMHLGRANEASELLIEQLAITRPGPQAVMLTGLAHIVLTWGQGNYSAAAELLQAQAKRYPRWTPVVREVFGFTEADGLTYAGRPAEALAKIDSLRSGGGWRILGAGTPLGKLLTQVQARITQSRALALTQLARPAESVQLLTTGHTAARLAELEVLIPSWRGSYLTILSHAMREAGAVTDALTHARAAYSSTLDVGFIWGRAWAACNVAASHLQQGELDKAADWAQQTIEAARAGHLTDAEHIGLMLLSVAEGSRGRQLGTEHLERLAELERRPGFLWHQLPIGDAWRAHANGQPSVAASICEAGVAVAERDGAAYAVLWICHEWLRLGHRVPVADRMERAIGQLSAAQTGDLARARVALAGGVQHGDPALARVAATLFESLEMPLFAAEAFAVAASLSDGREGVAHARRAQSLAAQVGSPATPLLASLGAHQKLEVLTKRERLIAELAPHRSNIEIAAQLHLSVRTVEHHLSSVYGKLGISGRAGLRDAL